MQLLISSRDKIAKEQHYMRAKALCLCRTFAVYGHKSLIVRTVVSGAIFETFFHSQNTIKLIISRFVIRYFLPLM